MLWQSFIDLYNSNPNANVYIHNFSNFDYILLIKILFENFEVIGANANVNANANANARK